MKNVVFETKQNVYYSFTIIKYIIITDHDLRLYFRNMHNVGYFVDI